MLFYKIDAVIENESIVPQRDNRDEYRMFTSEMKEKSESFFEKTNKSFFFFISSLSKNKLTIGGISKNADDINLHLNKYMKQINIPTSTLHYEETTLRLISTMLSGAFRCGFISDDDEILDYFNLTCLTKHRIGCDYTEAIVDKAPSIEKLMLSDAMLLKSSLADEIRRIYEIPAKSNVKGHPVHYLIRSDNDEEQKSMYVSLLSALYANRRILSKRYCYIEYNEYNDLSEGRLDAIYESCEYGTVVIKYDGEDPDNSQYSRAEDGSIADICKIALKYRNKVLTVVCFPLNSSKLKEIFEFYMGSTALVELYEDLAGADTANEYLKKLAKAWEIRTDKKLFVSTDENRLFTSVELREKFDIWYDNKLRNSLFPQYKALENGKRKSIRQKPAGSAYSDLQKMVGLSEAKETIDKMINYFKAKKLLRDQSISLSQPTMHMVFTGNPGTAKTTVARLFAQILKENGILSEGKLYEVGRADIVGKYVGQTAPLVKQAFKRAKGSVLFIDEAYSLVERDGLYGDEAINTIVQEMENNRNDTVVIFAGYPKEIEDFLNKNPGLRSRIAHHIHFDDYSADELCQISSLIAKQKGVSFTADAIAKLKNIFEIARHYTDFGNGRYARNIVENAQMAQINRIMQSSVDYINKSDIHLITANDIAMPSNIKAQGINKIGFTA